MWNLKRVFLLSLIFAALPACGAQGAGGNGGSGSQGDPISDPDPIENTDPLADFVLIDKTYTKSDQDIVNPGRGFYTHTETRTSFFVPLDRDELVAKRNLYQSASASYSVSSSVVLRAFILDSYIENPVLSEATLASIRADFVTAREAGVKMVLRFYYHKNASAPYGDPDKEIILAHIEQLAPILTDNADVILAVQQGFIGAWGEQYYTDNFSPVGDVTASYTEQNWIDRSEVLEALLAATAETTMVQVRTPQAKQKYVYGADAPLSSGLSGTLGSLSAENAFSGEDIARVGFHNDCFLTDASDTGTYSDYGTAGGVRAGNAADILKNYHKHDSQFVLVGGETCKDESWATPPVPHANDCSDGAVNIMDEFNYSYLNTDYNNTVNNDWTEGDDACMDEIKKGLGYRLAISLFISVAEARAGNYVPFLFAVENDGFTAPSMSMEVRFILKNRTTGQETTLVLDTDRNDVRAWQPGVTEVTEYIKLPEGLAAGDYDVFLHIADISNNGRVAARPEYSIQLANVGLWDAETGYNDLQQSISVGSFVADDIKNIEPSVQSVEAEESNEAGVVYMSIDGDAADWESISPLASAGEQQAQSLKVIASDAFVYVAIAGNDMESKFNLFINSDGDSETGFQSYDWILSGADYLIEHATGGFVSFYKSTGADWGWEQQGINAVEAYVSESFIELRIAKAAFDASGAVMSFGFNELDADWDVRSRLPLAGEIMPIYALPLDN